MERHRVDLVSLLLGLVALGWAIAVLAGWTNPDWFTADAGKALLVLVPALVVAVLVVQFLLGRMRRHRDGRSPDRPTASDRPVPPDRPAPPDRSTAPHGQESGEGAHPSPDEQVVTR